MAQVHVVTEDILSEVALQKIIAKTNKKILVASSRVCSGFGQIKKNLRGYNAAAQIDPWIVLTDLDNEICASALMSDWFVGIARSPKLIFRIAVREIESWLMADRAAMAQHLKVQINRIAAYPDNEPDPKLSLIQLAKSSGSSLVRKALVPIGTARQGRGHNSYLTEFIQESWSVAKASANSDSLERAVKAIQAI